MSVDANALRYACELGYMERVRELIPSVDINTIFYGDMTALNIALISYHPEIALLLLEEGASVLTGNKIGLSPLHIACQRDYPDIVSELCDRGANINAQDSVRICSFLYSLSLV